MNHARIHAPRHLDVTGLTCLRAEREIFADLSFSVAPGTALLLRGPNGAGKTSLMMCLAGFLHTQQGTIVWQGRDPEQRPGEDMHFIGHQSAVKPDLSVNENLKFWASINGGDPANTANALEAAGIGHTADLDAALLSAGQTRRLALARLLAAPRPVWLLDEPTSALDAAGDKWIAGLIDTHLDQGGLVIAATHLDLALKPASRIKTLDLGATA